MTNEKGSQAPIPPFGRRLRRKLDAVRVAPAGARGLGVFATAPIKARHAVGRVLGEIKEPSLGTRYCVAYGDDKIIEPVDPYRFLNHTCDPNCELIEWTIVNPDDPLNKEKSEPLLEIWVHAIRDVDVGEELTIDYGWDWRSAIKCLCGSPNCRGWICRIDQLELCKRHNEPPQFEDE